MLLIFNLRISFHLKDALSNSLLPLEGGRIKVGVIFSIQNRCSRFHEDRPAYLLKYDKTFYCYYPIIFLEKFILKNPKRYIKAANVVTTLNPKKMAMITAETEAITEQKLLVAHSQGIRLFSFPCSIELTNFIPKGKGIPIKNPKGKISPIVINILTNKLYFKVILKI